MAAPRAVILGWGNALRSQLVVYEKLYAGLGFETTCAIPDTRKGLVRPEAYVQALAPVAADLASERGGRPVVVHLFSDNGFIGWAALLDALSKTEAGREARDAIRGVVLDCSPGLWNVKGPLDFARRFALGMTPAIARVARLGARERLRVVTPLLTAGFLGYQVLFPRAVRSMRSASERVIAHQPRCPHLFVYGEDDILVPPADVRAWIDAQRRRGLEAEEHAFPGARHVALFPKDPRRYRAVVSAFTARVLGAP